MGIMKTYAVLVEDMLADTYAAVSYWGDMALSQDGLHTLIDRRVDSDEAPEEAGESFDAQGYMDRVFEWCKWVEGRESVDDYTKRFVHAFQQDPRRADYDAVILDCIAQFIAFGEYRYA